jgi:ribosomal peptide maturation radical SAM protein 1
MASVLLVNLPFASIKRPSLALTQLKSRLKACLGDRVSVNVLYLNLDFAHYMSLDFYNEIAETMDHHSTGLGDWFFRQVAFPELPTNTDEYFRRCYPRPTKDNVRLRKLVEEKRSGLHNFLAKLIDDYRLDQADIVGFSSTFAQNVACVAMARLLKTRSASPIILMGGANCESVMGREIATNIEVVDFVFSGPALVSLPQFVRNYIDDKFEEMYSIPGVFSRKSQRCSSFSVVGQTPDAPIGEEFDINVMVDLDYTDYLAKLKSSYADGQVHPSLLFETSRGCWWGEKAHCTFCGLNGQTMSYRSMSPDQAVVLLKSLFRHADICSLFESVDNIMPRHYVQEVFTRLSTPPNTTMFYEVKADLSEGDLAILSGAGVRRIQPGIESFATSTLRLMKKGTTATQNVEFLRNCLMHGVEPYWNLLVGFPGEKADVYQKYCHDLPLLTHLVPPSGVFPVRFDRFSPYFNKAKEYHLDLNPMAYYALTYPFDRQILANLAYYFSNHNYDADYLVALAENIGKVRDKIESWRQLWTKELVAMTLQPKLHFIAKTGGEILDSRSGATLRLDVGPLGRRVLEFLYKPKVASMLSREFPDTTVDNELEILDTMGLLFREGERVVGLVCPHEPMAAIQQ